MTLLNYIPKVNDLVEIPTSNLGKEYGFGKVVRKWHNTIQVDFAGNLGQYTVSKHTILPVKVGSFNNMEVYTDSSIPLNEIHIKG